MNHRVTKTILGIALGVTLGCATSAFAVDITISDKVYSGTGWYGNHEDNETEPGTIMGQQWDLERMDLSGNQLSIIGGYNFINGEQGFMGGDIFIDINGDAVYGQDAFTSSTTQGYKYDSNANYKYDYAIVFNRDSTALAGGNLTGGYSIYKLDDSSQVITAHYRQNDESNPFRLDTTGLTPIAGLNGTMDFSASLGGSLNAALTASLTAGLAGYAGNETHHVMSIDLSGLAAAEGINLQDGTLFHYTVGCGNDNLMGYAVPDGGMTVALLGLALIGIGTYQRSVLRKRRV